MFTTDKVGETMHVSLDPKQAKEWFGGVPPDLTLVARSRADIAKGSGADYLYTYLRTYYRDDTKATGWNNLAFPDVGDAARAVAAAGPAGGQVHRAEGPARPDAGRCTTSPASSSCRPAR